ncbi:MAG: 4Fe-4S binding protein, partial [Candidatus Syntrophosphaera sp.]
AHIEEKRCPSQVCTALLRYEIDPEKCIGCTACARVCPVNCISGEVKKTHVIDQSKCIKCGACYKACKFGAITKA